MTKTAEKAYPLGRTYLYSPYKEVPPPPGLSLLPALTQRILEGLTIATRKYFDHEQPMYKRPAKTFRRQRAVRL